MFKMKDGIELRRFRKEAKMKQTRPSLSYVAAAHAAQVESTNEWSKTTKKARDLKLNG